MGADAWSDKLPICCRCDHYLFLQALQPILDQFERLAGKHYHHDFETQEEFADQLLDYKEDTLDPVKRFMNGSQPDIYDAIQLFLERGEANYRYVEMEEITALREVREHPHPYRGQLMQSAADRIRDERYIGNIRDRVRQLEEVDFHGYEHYRVGGSEGGR